MADRHRTFDDVSRELQSLFGLSADQIAPEARLAEDLDLDSIDAVDLIVRLQEITNRRVSQDQFKSVRTVADIVVAVEKMLAE